MKNLRLLGILLSIIGICVSTYVSYTKLTGGELICTLSTCDLVTDSPYAYIFGVPMSVYGMIFYTGMLASLILRRYKIAWWLSIAGVLFTGYLTFIEAFVIHAWCQWCLLSAWVALALFVVMARLRREPVSDYGSVLERAKGAWGK